MVLLQPAENAIHPIPQQPLQAKTVCSVMPVIHTNQVSWIAQMQIIMEQPTLQETVPHEPRVTVATETVQRPAKPESPAPRATPIHTTRTGLMKNQQSTTKSSSTTW